MTNYGVIKVKGEMIIYEICDGPKKTIYFYDLEGNEIPHISNEGGLIEGHIKQILKTKKSAKELISKLNNDSRFRK